MAVIARKKTHTFQAQGRAFRTIYYTIAWIQTLTALICLIGQTTGIFFYDWAAHYGLQEHREEVGPSIVQVNRAFCTSDTILYIPILISSAYGLFQKKRCWSLICTAASAGVHSHWAITVAFILLSLDKNDIEGYTRHVPAEIWSFIGFYLVYGILVLEFLYYYWDILFVVTMY